MVEKRKKREIHYYTTQIFFRQINVLLKDFTVNQFDKKKKFLAVNFSFFHVIFPQND